eukprot:10256546-Alexandrium_andersonii.AAC.1
MPRAPATPSSATRTPRPAGRVWRATRTRCSARPAPRPQHRSSAVAAVAKGRACLLYTSPSPRD